ncbi:valine--tRNA ligase [Natranaerobius thermophilus]|uniref:Valine--tRNA ligase n=1 Tax=Natranaerobius thermophilus (strain ATCC BAA-1301 / DSM 18059 / JW/NM-WN-LF) TaxID=457570 RepID=B2A1F2_NATTJ|nr:valine--tRNA ligase [Natranaerobius thermophilus]ACB84692.1 valyl-tRNA synthetase [Natranaerobius thermophilus JW/NM-WN-LF]
MSKTNLSKVYEPEKVEQKWYQKWLDADSFKASCDHRDKFSVVIPPPNVTGSLHMGHALDNTLQDVIVRFKRMQGYDTLWMPGTDHAGIATQTKVEEHLAQEDGVSKYDLGREKFLEKVWAWKETYHDSITNQLKKLGVSVDWSRERFTMDEGCSKAVREVFVSLYEKGLIYQGDYIINWCPRCYTALSDIEVEHMEDQGTLTHIKYPLTDGSGSISVATTRPETMLGDTAVAVHPDDERYSHLIGKTVMLPLMDREIPIIADEFVDPEFGSGAVKVTPGHDPNDFEMGERHTLESIAVIGKDGQMTNEARRYSGMDRYECRKSVIQDLKDQGYLLEIEDHNHSIGHCHRCDTVVEPLVSKQWFVKMKPLAGPAIDVVDKGDVKFVPARFEKIYRNWMENIRDWCISRQIWWGHRIPAWYCQCGEIIVSRKDPDSCPSCGESGLEQDPDVLDTWFSSALWPFSTMGWPDETDDLQKFYPTDVLVTGYDIIFFWVARMIFMGLEFMKERPFDDVFIHGLVRDAHGRKMSKSLGNGIDPLEIIDEYGADTLRYTLVTGITPGNDMRFSYDKVEASRNFANKIWNASRFAIMNLDNYQPMELSPEDDRLSLADKWILHRMNEVIDDVTRLMDKYELGEASKTLYEFIWSEFCDWYIEMAKIRLYQGSEEEKSLTQEILVRGLDTILRLLHPFMPFLSEEIRSHLPHTDELLVTSKWPEKEESFSDETSKKAMEQIMEGVRAVRNLRRELDIVPQTKSAITILASDASDYDNFNSNQEYFRALANASPVEVVDNLEEKPKKALTAVVRGAEIFLPLEGLVDLDEEIERLRGQKAELDKEVARVEGKLANDNFVNKAPQYVVDKEREKERDYKERLAKVQERLDTLLAMKE